MDRCSACPDKHTCVMPNGPPDASIYGLGEAPGLDEDKRNEPFCGKTGIEVNDGYMPVAGLRRSNVRVGNVICCLPDRPKNKIKLDADRDRILAEECWKQHGKHDVTAYPRELIIGMGAFANYVLKKERIDLEIEHGMPYESDYGTVFPMFHPAMGLHEPKKMLHIRTDWSKLKRFLGGTLRMPRDIFAEHEDYLEIETPEELDVYILGTGGPRVAMAIDTEITRRRLPYCLSFSCKAGTGRVVRADNRKVLTRLQHWLSTWQDPVLFHNWLFDSEVVEEMNLQVPYERVVDTMVKVFHLGNWPQGLKALAYRELGMKMEDFDDVVHEDSRNLVLKFYQDAFIQEWPVPEADVIKDGNGDYKVYKPQGFRTKLKRFWTDFAKNPEKDVFEHWTVNWVEHQEMVEKQMGREWPGKCISYVPWPKVIHYACRDADATLRLWDLIKYVETRVHRYPQELWTDGYPA